MLCQAQAAGGGVDGQPRTDTAVESNTSGWASKSGQAASTVNPDDCASQRTVEDSVQHLTRLPHQCVIPTDEDFRVASPCLWKCLLSRGLLCVWDSAYDITSGFP